MLKRILAGTAVLAIVGSTFVYAQSRPGRSDGGARWQPSMEDVRAFGEARLAALKAGLLLTAEQERNWPAFEQAARELAKLRMDRRQAFAQARRETPRTTDPRTTDPIERLRERGNVMAQTGAALQRLAETADPLYKSLDDNQKRRFAMLSRIGVARDGRGGGPGVRGRDGGPDGGSRGFERGTRRMEFAPGRGERGEGFDGARPDGRRGPRLDAPDGGARPPTSGEERL
jgi:hypothetical protein